MEIDIELTKEHWINYNKYIQKKTQKEIKNGVTGFWGSMVLWLFLGMILLFIYKAFVQKIHWPTVIFISLIFILICSQFMWSITKLQKSMVPSKEGIFIGKHHFTLDNQGIHSTGGGYKNFYEWSVVKRVECTDDAVMIFIDNIQAFIFPVSQLGDAAELKNEIKKYKA